MVRVDIPEEDLQPHVLEQALAGRVAHVPASVALGLVARIDLPSVDRAALFEQTVASTAAEPNVRAAAVRMLMRTAGSGAVDSFVRMLDAAEERIAAAAAAALGQVGTPDCLPALRQQRQGGPLLQKRMAFARALLVHRYGLVDQAAPLPPFELQTATRSIGTRAFKTGRPGAERRQRALQGIQREFPAFEPGEQSVYEIQCGPRLLAIAVDRRFMGAAGAKELLEKPALPAIVAYKDVEYDEYHPRLLALSLPHPEHGLEVVLTRLSGDPVYVARGLVEGDRAELELVSVQAPGVPPVSAALRLSAKELDISGFSERQAAHTRSPRPM